MLSGPLKLHPYFPSHPRLLLATAYKCKKKGLTLFAFSLFLFAFCFFDSHVGAVERYPSRIGSCRDRQ